MTGSEERLLQLLKDARRKLESERRRRSEPIAIVGVGCRFPGGASTPAAFWQLLADGIDATGDTPIDRWDADALYDPDPDAPGKSYVKRGGFLPRIDEFEPEFFGISPREAEGLDPQQRLLLEVVWEALEDAGIPVENLRGSATGVWVGLSLDDYARRTLMSGQLESIDPYSALGNARSVAAGRIAYVLGVHGPTMQLDTACSSSLVAVHLACQSLRASECEVAIACGVNLISSPEATVALCKLRALARDGRCKTFDAAADGYGRGEGAGVLVLKRLSDAQLANDRIYAVIRGSAINHDGRSNGLTAPNGTAQEAVIRAALANAGVQASAVGYVEAHGTGTPLGDPIEVLALNRVYGQGRSPETPLYLASVKTNFGHLEGAAGIAGLIKAVLCLSNRRIARQLHFHKPNPKIPWEQLAVRVATETVDWTPREAGNVAAVSSFGISGTNAHVLVEEAPAASDVASAPRRSFELFVLSARTEDALHANAERLRERLPALSHRALGDIAYSLHTTRSLLYERAAVVVPSHSTLADALRALPRRGKPAGNTPLATAPAGGRSAWLFTGQGAQECGMGHLLYQEWPAFREALDAAFGAFDKHLDRPLRQVMWAEKGSIEASLLDQTGYTQPALFAFEWALAALWRSWGVKPDLLAGHSIGEMTAAAVAGVFSLDDAALLVCRRGRLMQSLPTGGAMVAIAASPVEVADAVEAYGKKLSVAAVNGPSSVVISGDEAAAMAVAERFRNRGVEVKRLTVSHAFHSALMDPMLDPLLGLARTIEYRPPSIPLVSNVSGRLAGPEISTPAYWVRHVRQTVRFGEGVEALKAEGCTTFLEIGPRATLLPLVSSCWSGLAKPLLLPSGRAGRKETESVLQALGEWIVHGGSVDWSGVYPAGGRRVPLPTYAWQRRRYWIEAPTPNRPQPRAELAGDAARNQTDEGPASWFYGVQWRPKVFTGAGLAGSWALLGSPQETPLLASALARAGATPIVMRDVEELRSSLLGGTALSGVVYLMELRASGESRALELQQVLASAGSHAPRCFWMTRGAVGTNSGDAPTLHHSAMWGLARSVALAQPRTWGGLIDLPEAAVDEPMAARLVALLTGAGADGEDQLAIRGHEVLVPRLLPRPPAARPWTMSKEGTALITGGLGGLGLHVARWLARRGQRHLLLVNRRGLEAPGARQAMAELEGLGAKVTVVAASVENRDAMKAALGAVRADAPLTAVFHLAGIGDVTPVEALDAARLARVLEPKQRGTLILDDLTRSIDLELFVCFSSIAGVFGAGKQAAYAAANAFLDAWAAAARGRGRRAFSLAFGPWAGEGMAADDASRMELERRGLRPMRPEDALVATELALASGEVNTVIADIDWEKYRRSYEAWGRRPLLADLPLSRKNAETAERPADGQWTKELASLTPAHRAEALQEMVRSETARVLRMTSPSQVPLDGSFNDLGVDSLMALEIREALSRKVGRTLSATLVFDQPSPRAIVGYLLGLLFESPARDDVAVAARAATSDEPIAIVGIGCRFPGGVSDPESFWRLLEEGRDAVTEVPKERWDIDAWYDPDPGAPAKMTTRWGGFLPDIERFDSTFFGISPREAAGVDPQERLLLETTWEALEHAGLKAESLMGSATGVYVGLCGTDYQQRAMSDVAGSDAYPLLGTMHSTIVGRLSYWLGLKGPNLAVDTACSSSLVAVHLACQALRAGECDLALAGGANVLLSPEGSVYLSRMAALSPTGRCRTFSADADGYVRSEGAGVLVLERLSEAQKKGHRIVAIIRGTAVNQDGRSNGPTAPNGPAQEAVIRDALRRAGVRPADVDYVECHGTGTPLGDPIEVQALAAVLAEDRPLDRPLLLGSLKSNLGHTEGAAGVAGIIKAALSLEHRRIPKSLHFKRPNPHIPWSTLPVKVAAEAMDWPGPARPRIAGVSSFGISGTNAHLVLEEAPPIAEATAWAARGAELVVLSARSEGALRATASRLCDYLEAHSEIGLQDIAFNLATKRSAMEQRLAIAATNREALASALRAVGQGEATAHVINASASESAPKLAWLFTGQGAQRIGMGAELYREWPVFRESLDAAWAAVDKHLPRPLREVMWAAPGSPDAELLNETAYTQPALFAFEWALAALWRSWGVEPDFVAGHSIGEIAAACVAGVFSLADGARLVCERGRLMQALSRRGAMVAVAAPVETVLDALAADLGVEVAAVNGPASVVISGDEAKVLAVAERFAARGIETKRLVVSHAFHSPLMEPVLEPFRTVARTIAYRPSSVPLISNASGQLAGSEAASAEYWVSHVRRTVRFSDGIVALHRAGAAAFLEIGPRATLLPLAQQTLARESPILLASIRAASSETQSALQALGGWFARGGTVDWGGVFPGRARRLVLPSYPWQRRRHWIEAPQVKRGRASAPTGNPLLEARIDNATADATYQAIVSADRPKWLGDHPIGGRVVVPGAAIVEFVRAAAVDYRGDAAVRLKSVVFERPCVLPDEKPRLLQVVLTEEATKATVYSRPDTGDKRAPWSVHAVAEIGAVSSVAPRSLDVAKIRRRCAEAVNVEEMYRLWAARGLDLGPSFQGLGGLWRGEREALAEIALADAVDAEGFGVHPALLDAVFQASFGVMSAKLDALYIPSEVLGFELYRPSPRSILVHVRLLESHADEAVLASLSAFDLSGNPVAAIDQLTLRKVDVAALGRAAQPVAGTLYRVEWRLEENLPREASLTGRWLVVPMGEGEGAHEAVAQLAARGAQSELLPITRLAEADAADHVVCFCDLSRRSDQGTEAMRAANGGLAVTQILSSSKKVPRLWWVTRKAVATASGDEVWPAAGALWGLGRTVAQEHPELASSLVDIDEEANLAHVLACEVGAEDRENQVAWRGSRRHVPRLVRAPAGRPAGDARLRLDGTVLITGGLGALGLAVAEHLARRGVRHLVLVSRRGLAAPGVAETIATLERAGARVTVAPVDVADFGALSGVLAAIPASDPLRGIIHAAGVLDDGVLSLQTNERFSKVMAPKVTGAWNLHLLTERAALDFFVLFSSMAGTVGSSAQGGYAAANTFLDALAAHRRSRELAGMSVAWGPWSGRGFAANLEPSLRARFDRQGLRMLAPSEGLALLDAAMARPEAQLVGAAIDLPKLARAFAGTPPPVWRALIRQPANGDASARRSLRRELAHLAGEQRVAAVVDLVRSEVSRVLMLASSNDVPPARPLKDLGVDSLLALELRNALERLTEEALPATLLFHHPTVDAIAKHLLAKLFDRAEDVPARSATAAAYGEQLNSLANPQARLFCFPDAGGSAAIFVPFCELGKAGIEVHALSHTRLLRPTVAWAAQYLEEAVTYIRRFSDRPYALLGHSLGGFLAWRVAQELARRGTAAPALIVQSASALPHELGGTFSEGDLDDALRRVSGSKAQSSRVRADFAADVLLWHSLPKVSEVSLDVPIAAFVGRDDHLVNETAMRSWARSTTAEFSLTVVPGGHFYLVEEQVRGVAFDQLARRIIQALHPDPTTSQAFRSRGESPSELTGQPSKA